MHSKFGPIPILTAYSSNAKPDAGMQDVRSKVNVTYHNDIRITPTACMDRLEKPGQWLKSSSGHFGSCGTYRIYTLYLCTYRPTYIRTCDLSVTRADTAYRYAVQSALL